ncbi:phospholipase D family protein [Methylotuvimicrobium buryatense]|uniref:Phospholipase D-like domain-containing protein n=1 Tax=Methylotuvimicrobium buryatense TaxID=95641 RepID=A0A4P9UUB1_METBY|nr:phospholipase D family protein [Methylotuvimicrobium buryatense]QCW84240.1 hypothetical protein EQU24_19895 [Methylotuvimicrobium buryatense]
MAIYLNPTSDSLLYDAYVSAFENADEIFVLSAYLRDWKNFELSDECKNATLIVGKDFGITRKKALSDALIWKNAHDDICHFFVTDKIDGFHPKIVMWKQGGERFLIIGSSNLTVAAFESNYEANLKIKIDKKRYQEISNWIADILGRSRPVDQKWINAYPEAALPNPRPKPSSINNTIGSLHLPKFPGLAKAIAERKERTYASEEIRTELEQAVRDCATGKMVQDDFYFWLIQNWNGAKWKFQGNGIFRHSKEATNWQMLCETLIKCITANGHRDAVVQTEYDQLEKSGQAEVRKAFLTEMLCHFFPEDYPLWNKPVITWLTKVGVTKNRPRGLSEGGKYIWLAEQLRTSIKKNPDYPATNLAELDHVIWAYCEYKGWNK